MTRVYLSLYLSCLYTARPERDVDHLPPSSAKVKNVWELYLLSAKRLCGVWWDNFSFLQGRASKKVLRQNI
jgi:hypothetical protein